MNLISVIVPYYKKKDYIKSTINSVLKQTHKNLEILLIYDDSSFQDLDYIKMISKSDNRIKLLINKKNIGAGKSRNIGIKKSKGKFIAFLDADDLWLKNKLRLQFKFMKKNNYRISHTTYEIIDKQKKSIGLRRARTFYFLKDLIESCDIGLSTIMMEKKIFSRGIMFTDIKTKEDFILWLQILKKGIPIGALDIKLTKWRKLDNSLSSPVYQKLKNGFLLYNKHMKFNFFKSIYFLFILSFNYLKK